MPRSRPARRAVSLYRPRLRTVAYGIVVALFLLGAGAGALAVKRIDGSHRQDLTAYVQQLAGAGAEAPRPATGEVLARAAWDQGVRTIGLMWVMGLSIIGAPFILGTVFARGYGLGFTAAFLMGDGAWEGTLLTLAGVMPHSLFFVPGIVLAAGAALSFSVLAAAIILGRRQLSAFGHFVTTTMLCAVGVLLLLAGTLVEAYITPVLLQTVGAYFHVW